MIFESALQLLLLIAISQRASSQLKIDTEVLIKAIPKVASPCAHVDDLPPEWTFLDFIQRTNYYIDKTLLLREILANEKHINMLITAPPKWGKTVNLKMIEFFLKLEIDDQYRPIPIKKTAAYKFFTEGKFASNDKNASEMRFTKPPLISKYPKFIEKHLARYNVLYLDFGEFGPADTFHRFFTRFRTVMSKIFVRYTHCKMLMVRELEACRTECGKEEAEEIANLITYLVDKFEQRLNMNNMEEGEWLDCLVHLTKMLNEFYEGHVVLLVDNYDYFINMTSRMHIAHRETVVDFIQYFAQCTFYDNFNIHKCLATGVLPIVMGDITNTTGRDEILNVTRTDIAINATSKEIVAKPAQEDDANFTCKDFVYLGNMANELYPFYGFARREFRQIFDYANISPDLYIDSMRRYGGYFNDTVMNPRSVCEFLDKRVIADYWAQENDVNINELNITTDSARFDILSKFMQGHCIPYEFSIRLPLIFPYGSNATALHPVWTSEQIVGKLENFESNEADDDFLLYLLAKGILTVARTNSGLCLHIANEENKAVVRKRFPNL